MKTIRIFASIFTFIEFALLFAILFMLALHLWWRQASTVTYLLTAFYVVFAVYTAFRASQRMYAWLPTRPFRMQVLVCMIMMVLSVITVNVLKFTAFMAMG